MMEHDVIVVGGGVVGLSAALALSQRGYEVALCDAGVLDGGDAYPDRRLYAINARSAQFFRQLGVWCAIEAKRSTPYRQMKVWDELSGAELGFHAKEIAKDRLGDMVEETVIKSVLLAKINTTTTVKLYRSTRIVAVEENQHGVALTTEDQQILSAKLLVIADGAHSTVRNLLKVQLTSWPYQQDAIVAAVETTKPHQQTAYQVFKKNGPLAFLPLHNPYHSAIVWSTSAEEAKALMALDDAAFSAALTQAFLHRLGEVKCITSRAHFPLVMRHTQQYVGSRWILVGDAAHTIHPLAGLGLNVGLMDVSDWLALQDKWQHSPWSTRVLSAYQRKRKSDVWQVILLMDAIKAAFGAGPKPQVLLRGLGMGLLQRFGLLKRMVIRYATGESD